MCVCVCVCVCVCSNNSFFDTFIRKLLYPAYLHREAGRYREPIQTQNTHAIHFTFILSLVSPQIVTLILTLFIHFNSFVFILFVSVIP